MNSSTLDSKLRACGVAGLSLLLAACALIFYGRPITGVAAGAGALRLDPVIDPNLYGFSQPVYVTDAGDGSGRLFVVEKGGVIKIIKHGAVLPQPFLDISDHVGTLSEAGLLSIAFPPDYATSGDFFVYYNHSDPNLVPPPNGEPNGGFDTVVARFRVTADPDVADPASEERILLRNQPYQNHNGGEIAFGPDGYLYIGLGDGGDAGDPLNSGQRLDTVLGKILRIQVGATGSYTIPATNPFVNTPGAKGEIWDLGLRNPWRWSFDRATGDLLIGDVGQDHYEELDMHPAGTSGGLNFGWNCREGLHPYANPPCTGAFTDPFWEYDHTVGIAVTGGYVYRGTAYPNFAGKYFFADFGGGQIWSTTRSGSGWTPTQLELSTGYSISSFGEDQSGELYVVSFGNGMVYHIVDSSTVPPTATATPTDTPVPGATPTATPTPTNTSAAGDTSTPTATATLPVTATVAAAPDFRLPGTQPGQLVDTIVDPAVCSSCHTEPIYQSWRGSMMSQAGRDPVFWAALRVAEKDMPGSGDYCLRCHTPKGWFEGRSQPSDGSALQPKDMEVGVACEVCHRMVSPAPSAGDEATVRDAAIRAALAEEPPVDHPGSAMLILDPEDNRRGPFALATPPPHPKATWRSDFLGQDSNPVTEANLCGTCHTLDNPALSWDPVRNQYWPNAPDQPPPSVALDALFPVERTFDEWRSSDYATAAGVYAPQFAGNKVDGIVRTCQDCHMPRTVGAATYDGGVPRDCVTTGCLPAHVLVGGNTWVPQLLQDPRWRLAARGEAATLDNTVNAARAMLQNAATLSVTVASTDTARIATVRVSNESGHKLPTGYAEGRRMWIALEAFDAQGARVYASGLYDANTGVLADDPALKVYEVQQGITPELAAQLGQQPGASFHFVLNNTVVKDNRIPPRGYTVAAYNRPGMQPIGAAYADGQNWDDTTYTLPVSATAISVTLYYQTASKAYIDFLRQAGGSDGDTLGKLWDDRKSPPEAIAATQLVLDPNDQPPVAEDDLIIVPFYTTPFTLDVLANDRDPDPGDSLTLLAVSRPNQGTAVIAHNAIIYTPPPAFNGEVQFTYTARDRSGRTATGQVLMRPGMPFYLPFVYRQSQ